MKLSNQTILITGAALRIGRAIAIAAAHEGANILLHYHSSLDAVQSLAEEIRVLGRQALPLQADLSDASQITGLFEQASSITTIHALVNNASIFGVNNWETTTLFDWDQHLRVNLTAPFLLTQAFARALPSDTNGRVLNMLDWRALRPGPDHLPYTISKAGLAALTRSLAITLAPRISVNGLALGAILPAKEVDGDHKVQSEQLDEIIQPVPAQRWAELQEVQEAAIFLLAGPDYINGEILHLDGGRHLV